MKNISNFIFELGSARRILRSHKQFIGTSDDSISDHTFRVVFISLLIAQNIKNVNVEKILKMALIHDLPEIRTGDLNPVNKFYVSVNEVLAFKDQVFGLDFLGTELLTIFEEYLDRKSVESNIVKDADLIDQIALQVEYSERGVKNVELWSDSQFNSLFFEYSKSIAKDVISGSSFDWLHNLTLKNDRV